MTPNYTAASTFRKRLCEQGADTALLALVLSWGYASLWQGIPCVPWEYPCAAAACVWSTALLRRTKRHRFFAFLSLLLPFLCLTCCTGTAFLAYLCIPWAIAGLSLLIRPLLPSFSRALHCYAAALFTLAPAAYLSLSDSPVTVFRDGILWLIGLTLLFLFAEQPPAHSGRE